MTDIIRVERDVDEGTDNWNVGAIAVPRAGFSGPVLLTQSDVNGLIGLSIFEPSSSTAVYSTTFAKTLSQDGVQDAIHAAAGGDSLWQLDDIGYNFQHQIRQADVGALTLKGGRRYQMVYTFPTARDGNVKAIFVWNVRPLH